MRPDLLSERLRLPPLSLDDLDISTEILTDPDVMRFVGDVMTPQEAEAELSTAIKRCGGGAIGIWCISNIQTDEKFGTVFFLPLPVEIDDTDWSLFDSTNYNLFPTGDFEIGYILKKSAWGKGFATEAAARLLRYAFEHTPLTEIVACIDDENERSRKALKKIGMVEVAPQRAYAEDDVPFFRITKQKWQEDNPARNLELETERLLLRPLCLDDLALCVEMWSDPDVMRFVGEPETAEEIEEYFHYPMRRCGDGAIGDWSIQDKNSQEKLGVVLLHPLPIQEDDTDWELLNGAGFPEAEIEIGYHLKKSSWGKGYATEATERLLRFAFEETPLLEIVATISDENEPSRNVLNKIGLKEVGTRLAYGEENEPDFRISRDEWQKLNPS